MNYQFNTVAEAEQFLADFNPEQAKEEGMEEVWEAAYEIAFRDHYDRCMGG